jgi:hypothetical protein
MQRGFRGAYTATQSFFFSSKDLYYPFDHTTENLNFENFGPLNFRHLRNHTGLEIAVRGRLFRKGNI